MIMYKITMIKVLNFKLEAYIDCKKERLIKLLKHV